MNLGRLCLLLEAAVQQVVLGEVQTLQPGGEYKSHFAGKNDCQYKYHCKLARIKKYQPTG